MSNLRLNYKQRKDVRQAIMSGFAKNPEPGSSHAESESASASITANQADANITYGVVTFSIHKLSRDIITLSPQAQMQAIADVQALVDAYKEVFDEVKAEYGYHGTFEQYIEDVLRVAESVNPDTPMEQIGNMVLTHSHR